MKNKLLISALFITGIMISSCVEDEIYLSEETVDSDVTLVINEVASNLGDPTPDWIEIYNPSDIEIDMSGFGVYDKPDAKYTFATGTSIAAKGYLVIICDKDLATSSPETYANFGISSGGETVYLVDATDAIIDEVDVPAMDLGISYARIPDGGDVFANANPTQGAANSNTNEAPVIEADIITTGMVNDNVRFEYDVVVKDASGLRSIKLWLQSSTETYYLDFAPLGGGEYRILFPLLTKDDEIQYYVEAIDETGLKTIFKPEDEDAIIFTVVDGLAIFNSVELSNASPAPLEDITVTVDAYDKSGIDGVRLYYLVDDDNAENKISVDMTFDGTVWSCDIPGQADESVIRYYIRATDNEGEKSYYPFEEVDAEGIVIGEFDHDDGSTWPSYAVASYEDVIFSTVNSTEGPLTSVMFPTNPVPGTDINVVLSYASSETILEARIYFAVGDAPEYVKANKIAGEDDASFTQTGVTINLKDAVTDGDGLSLSEKGAKVTFYVRIATATAEYYYSNDGTMYLDNTPGGGTTDESDDFKADPSLWNEYNVQ